MTNQIQDVVAIDGPAGAGKSTTARYVAKELHFAFLDTGAMYRAATWRAMRQNIDLDHTEAVALSTRAMKLELIDIPEGLTVIVDGVDASEAIRTPEVTRCIYKVDQNPDVRECLVALQRDYASRRPTVAEGRDMGTVVFPNARWKFYLDASLDERTHRRAADLKAKGYAVDFTQLREDLRERDEKSMTRAIAPLRRAPDAVYIDTTSMTPDKVMAAIIGHVKG